MYANHTYPHRKKGVEQLGERLDVMMKLKTASKITAAGVLAATLVLAMGTTVRTYAASLSADNHNGNAAGTAPQFAVSGSGILPDHTEEMAISLVAADRDFIQYEPPVFPDYFTETATGFVYTNGTKQNKIDISLTGYTSVNFLEKSASVSEPAVNAEAYTVFDATTNLNDSTITATDHFNSSDIPKGIADWMLTCRGSDKVNVKRSAGDGTVDTWIYYDSDSRMAWKMAADGNTIKIVLTDNVPELIQGATLIHYQAPEAYQDLEVFFKSEKLAVNVQ